MAERRMVGRGKRRTTSLLCTGGRCQQLLEAREPKQGGIEPQA